MNKNFNQRICTNFLFLSAVTVTLVFSVSARGQCGKIKYEKSVFETVSSEYKEKLLQRLEMFLQNKCEKRFEDLYEMLTPSFRELNKKEDFVKDMKSYYSENNRFISFRPTLVAESLSPKDKKASIWFIEGCLTEVINGKKRSIKTLLEAIREDGEIFFTDITTRPNPLGNNQKCKS